MAIPAFHAFLAPILAQLRITRAHHDFLRQQSAVTAIAERSRGAATRLVGLARVDDFQAIVVRRKSGPRRRGDLHDRRIGLPASHVDCGTARVDALRGATAVLKSEGLYYHKVDWVDLAPRAAVSLPSAYATEIAALREGGVDAVYVRGPAGLEAAGATDMRVLVDISADRDPWVRINTVLLRAVTVSESLLREHPQAIARELCDPLPPLPAHMNLDESALHMLEGLKTFMRRWDFIRSDFRIGSWADWPAPVRAASGRTVALPLPQEC